jgi:hypothetical protein
MAPVEAGQLEVVGRGRPLSSTGGPTQGFISRFFFVESEARQREPRRGAEEPIGTNDVLH